MAYKPNPNAGPVRDKAYPSQIAAERPALDTRHHCVEEMEIEKALRGGEHDMHTTNRVDRFNSQLRGGHRLNDNIDIPDDGR